MRATTIGSLPGTDMRGCLAEVAELFDDLIALPELPARGASAGMAGRLTAVLSGLDVDLGPGGWRLADSSDAAHRRARALLRQDLDDVEETLADSRACAKIAFCGPVTAMALLHLPRGEVVLADHGAVREVVQSMATGLAELVDELHRRMPQVEWTLQLDEPAMPAVLAGRIPTQSGLHTLAPVSIHEARRSWQILTRALDGTAVALHCCAPGVPLEELGTAIDPVFLDLTTVLAMGSGGSMDAVASRLEAGQKVGLGVIATDVPDVVVPADRIITTVVQLTRRWGIDPALVVDHGLLTPACGLAGWSVPAAREQMRQLTQAVHLVDEQLGCGK
ncbi:methionine synthase [Cutibacterium granulosum]|uniref:methionine synthase n=1 Tax=Cutibacterium granulosum TaxID=33011 RepID=UPI002B22AA24|nr:methionine synthase [Cutibacterium granulosum]MEA5639547.1 methionine synthase [Cutibacterium granulosum]